MHLKRFLPTFEFLSDDQKEREKIKENEEVEEYEDTSIVT